MESGRFSYEEVMQYADSRFQEHKKGGHPFRLSPYWYLAITLLYMRQYQTMTMLGIEVGVAKSTVCKVYNQTITYLATCGALKLVGVSKVEENDIELLDATESPINRPKYGQREYYSGKKKRHTIKSQILWSSKRDEIIAIQFDKGHVHDFELYKHSSATKLPESVLVIGDSGYQGIGEYHKRNLTPFKKPRGGQLTKAQKTVNRAIGKKRVFIEHVNCWLKRFRIIKGVYRNRRQNFWKPMYVICTLFNIVHPIK